MTDLTLSPRKAELFWAKVDKSTPGGCWTWTAAESDGYGRFGITRRAAVRAHRVSYFNLVGPIPRGLVLDHLCRNTLCVNPDHLEPVTNAENIYRGNSHVNEQRKRTHCPQGHAFDAVNTYHWRGQRKCKECHSLRQRKSAA